MTSQRSNRAVPLALAVTATLLALGGCAGAQIGDKLSHGMGGLPEAAPARPAAPLTYPAVHDLPPARRDVTLDEDEQAKLQSDLLKARDRQTTAEQRASPTKPLGLGKKKQPETPAAGATPKP